MEILVKGQDPNFIPDDITQARKKKFVGTCSNCGCKVRVLGKEGNICIGWLTKKIVCTVECPTCSPKNWHSLYPQKFIACLEETENDQG